MAYPHLRLIAYNIHDLINCEECELQEEIEKGGGQKRR
jgi:hypothetical protein